MELNLRFVKKIDVFNDIFKQLEILNKEYIQKF